MLYAVIDTNVIVSALLSDKEDTATVQVVKEVIKGNIIPIYSYEIVNEYRNVLNRRKFNFSKDKINLLLDAIYYFGILFEPEPFSFSLPDIKDFPFYVVVIQTQNKKSFLVTGNLKHFPAEPFIITPRQIINLLHEDAVK